MKNLLAMQEIGFDPWVRKIPGGGHGNPLQHSCLENPLDRGAWRATVTKSQTGLKQLSTDTHVCVKIDSIWTEESKREKSLL